MLLNLTDLSAEPLHSQISRQVLEKILNGDEKLQSHLQTKQVGFVFRDDRSGDYALLPSEKFPDKLKIDRHDELLHKLQQAKHPIVITVDNAWAKRSQLYRELLRRETLMAFPLLEANKLLGLIALCGKISGAGYSVEEQRLIMVLANQFVTALTSARFYVEAVQMRQMEEELLMAQQIQAGLLPKVLPNNEHLQLAAYSEPSRTVGGDFYDYLPIEEHRCGLVIADASGKGMPAAMLISQLQAILKNEAGNGQSLQQTMRNMNQHVKRYTSAKNFATLFYGVFDQRTGLIEFANAGHNYPILVRQNGAVELLKTTGPALGLHPDWNYATAKIKIGAGDALLLYTDGVNETMNRVEEQYGEERLQEVLIQNRAHSAEEILQALIEDLNAFHKSEALQDDRTIMVLKMKI